MTALVQPANAYTNVKTHLSKNTHSGGVTAQRHVSRCPVGSLERWPRSADFRSVDPFSYVYGMRIPYRRRCSRHNKTLLRGVVLHHSRQVRSAWRYSYVGARFESRPSSENTQWVNPPGETKLVECPITANSRLRPPNFRSSFRIHVLYPCCPVLKCKQDLVGNVFG